MATIKVGNINGVNYSADTEDTITITHEASMTSYDKMYAILDLTMTNAILMCDQGNGAGEVNVILTNGSRVHPIPGFRFGTTTFTVTHDASASSNGSAVYVRIVGNQLEMYSVVTDNTSGYIQDSEGANGQFNVTDDDNAAQGSYALEISGSDALQANFPDGAKRFIVSDKTRKFSVVGGTGGTQLYYDSGNKRLLANFGDTIDHTIDSSVTADYAKSSPFSVRIHTLVDIYFDEDASAGEKLIHAYPYAPVDLLVPLYGEKFVKLKYDASGASNGVPVYLDGGFPFSTLKFTSPTTTNGTLETHRSLSPVQKIVIV